MQESALFRLKNGKKAYVSTGPSLLSTVEVGASVGGSVGADVGSETGGVEVSIALEVVDVSAGGSEVEGSVGVGGSTLCTEVNQRRVAKR
jgi:hypothetical protein